MCSSLLLMVGDFFWYCVHFFGRAIFGLWITVGIADMVGGGVCGVDVGRGAIRIHQVPWCASHQLPCGTSQSVGLICRIRTMTYGSVHALRLFSASPPLKLKVLRFWRSVTPRNPDELLSLDFLAVDDKGDIVQCRIRGFDAPAFEGRIKESVVYKLSDFDVTHPKLVFNAIPTDHIITIRRTTKIVQLEEDPDLFLSYHFNFTPYDALRDRVNLAQTLTDVIGVIISMTSVTRVRLNNLPNDVEKRDLYIQDESGNSVKVVLYADMSAQITALDIEKINMNPVFIGAAMMVKKYEGELYLASCSATKVYLDIDIPEVGQLKNRYENQPLQFRYIPIENNPANVQQIQPPRTASIAELHAVIPTTSMRVKFSVDATIIHVSAPYGWYYNACNECGRGIHKIENLNTCYCQTHGPKIPILTCRLNFTIEDQTGQVDVVAFGRQAEKLIGATVTELITIGDGNKMVFPQPILQLVGQHKTLILTLTANSLDKNTPSYKLQNCEDNRKRKREQQSSATTSHQATTSAQQQEPAASPTPTIVARELFPDETPNKLQRTRETEPDI